MFEKRRCHYTYIFELFFKYVAAIVAMAVTFCLSAAGDMATDEALRHDMSGLPPGKILLMALAALVVFSGISLLYCTFKWRHTYVSVQEDALNYESGKFIRKRVTIPFEKINTIDMGRNVFEKLVGTCRLKIDTGAYSNRQDKTQPEMNLVFDLSEAYNIRRYILNRSELYDNAAIMAPDSRRALGEPDWAIRAGAGDFILYGLTSSSVWKLFCLPVLGVCVLAEISTAVLGRAAEAAMPFLTRLLDEVNRLGAWKALAGMLAAYLALSLVSNLFTVLWAAVRFFDFRVSRQGRNVIVRYGLFTEKNYTLQVRNIHALIVKQNLFQQMIGRCSVEAVCMGFGDEQTETALLFPIIRKKELNKILGVVLPEYVTEMHTRKRRSAGLLFHVVNPTLMSAAVCWGIDVIGTRLTDSMLPVKLVCAIMVVLVFVRGLLSYFTTTLDWNDRVVSVQSGGLRRILYRIRTDAVQEVQVKTNPVKDMFGIGTYLVHYHGPRLNNTSVSDNISSGYFAELAETLED